ncbi:MAG: hypothetical protein IJ570_06190 [Prevotella sp.]|nr:hypothetical protein [Bacteroidaceae bacterium]MBR1415434.1 hypothetical protein [Prevotella sp.]
MDARQAERPGRPREVYHPRHLPPAIAKNVDFRGISLYSSGNKFTALRIGWLMLGVGAGFLLGFLVNLMATYGRYASEMGSGDMWDYRRYVSGIVYLACICICGGTGLLLSCPCLQPPG